MILKDVEAVLLADDLNLGRVPPEELLRRVVCFFVLILPIVLGQLVEEEVAIHLNSLKQRHELGARQYFCLDAADPFEQLALLPLSPHLLDFDHAVNAVPQAQLHGILLRQHRLNSEPA